MNAEDPREHGHDRPFVLVVDDEEPIVRIVSKRLETLGYRIAVARNGHQAIEVAEAERPCLVVTDYQMPDADGLWLARQLFERFGEGGPPVVLLTAMAFVMGDEELAGTNIVRTMGKPFGARKLAQVVEEILGPSPEPGFREAA